MFSETFQWHFPVPAQGDYLTVIVDLMRPLSQNGEVKLNSTDPLEQPYINLNFFSNDLDLIALREGVRMIDDIVMNGEGMKDIPKVKRTKLLGNKSGTLTTKSILLLQKIIVGIIFVFTTAIMLSIRFFSASKSKEVEFLNARSFGS